jgi:hypothetical protein
MKRTPLKRKTPLRARHKPRHAPPDPKKVRTYRGINKKGKRVKEWDAVRAELKQECIILRITRCELRLSGCNGDWALGFAHSLKRRNIPPGSPLLREACLACNHCHDIIERLPERFMGVFVRTALEMRPGGKFDLHKRASSR